MNEEQSPDDVVSTQPDIQKLAQTLDDPRTGSWALTGLLLLAILAALSLAQEVILPVVLAFILSQVFAPVVRGLKKIRIVEPIGAAFVVVGLLAAVGGGGYYLVEPAGEWVEMAPQVLRVLDKKVRRLRGSVDDVQTATDQVQKITEGMTGGGIVAKPATVTMAQPSVVRRLFAIVADVGLSTVSTIVLLYFLLASGDLFLRKIIAVTPRLADKKRAVTIARQIEDEVSMYLFTVTCINITLGIAVGLAMYVLEVPNPILWGVMVGLFNFIPYLGDIASFGVLTVVGVLSFGEIWRGLLVPAVFYVLTATEGYFVTPMIVGKRMQLNPVVILVSILFWGWMWGVLGALLAVPILVVMKSVCDHVESVKAFGEFLGE